MTPVEHGHEPTEQHPEPLRPLLVNVSQASEILSLSRTTIYELIWSGELTPIHIGRSVRLAVEQLEVFVSERLREQA